MTWGSENIFTANKSSFMVFNPESLKSDFQYSKLHCLQLRFFFFLSLNEYSLLFRQSSLASFSIWLTSWKNQRTRSTSSVCMYVIVYSCEKEWMKCKWKCWPCKQYKVQTPQIVISLRVVIFVIITLYCFLFLFP